MSITSSHRKPRYKIEHGAMGMDISIPSRKEIWGTLFLLAWLVGWFFGEAEAIRLYLDNTSGYINDSLFFLAPWTLGGISVILYILWIVVGEEYIHIKQDEIVLEKNFWQYLFPRHYPLSEIRNMRTERMDNISSQKNNFSFNINNRETKRCIIFDIGYKTDKFGNMMDRAEANALLQEIQTRFPEIVYHD